MNALEDLLGRLLLLFLGFCVVNHFVFTILMRRLPRSSERRPQTPWQQHLAVERHAAQRRLDVEIERARLEAEVTRNLAELAIEMARERSNRRAGGGR